MKAGTLLGYEGRTGHATGCHLHYGLFSPFEAATFTLDPAVAKRMKLPAAEIARIDPRLVLPPWSNPAAHEPTGRPGPPRRQPGAADRATVRDGAGSGARSASTPGSRPARRPARRSTRRASPAPAGRRSRPHPTAARRPRPGRWRPARARPGRGSRPAPSGRAASLVLGADLGLGPPGRAAQEDRLPGLGHVAGHGPVARRRVGRRSPRPVPSGPPGGAGRTRRGRRSRRAGRPATRRRRSPGRDGPKTPPRSRSIARTVRWK